MEFNEQHKVIIKTLNPKQAIAFVKFLQSEIIRHKDDILLAQSLIREVYTKVLHETNHLY